MIETTITNSATTFTIGCSIGRNRFAKIQIGSVCCAPDVKIVTTTSSHESAKASSAAREQRRPELRERHVAERLPGVRAEVLRRLLEVAVEPPEPRDRVVEDDDDAEGRVPDDDRRAARNGNPTVVYVVCSASPVMIPGSAIGRITSSVIVSRPKNGNRAIASESERSEDDREHGRAERRLHREQQRVAHARVVPRHAEPLRREVVDRPALRDALVERVHRDRARAGGR